MAEQNPTSQSVAWPKYVLGTLTVVATLIAAVPGFLSLKPKRSLVAYDITASEIVIPPGADRTRIKEVLDKEQIPDSIVALTIENIGDQPAATVSVSITVPGDILAHKSVPSFQDKPAWVSVSSIFDSQKNSSVVFYELNKLAVGPKFKIDVSFRRTRTGDAVSEIYSDGFTAIPTPSGSDSQNAKFNVFKPLTIFVLGTLLTVAVSLFYTMKRMPELKDSVLMLFDAVSPFPFKKFRELQSAVTGHIQYMGYRSAILREIIRRPNVEITSVTEGKLKAVDPSHFWDIQLKISGAVVAIDAHTQSQNWFDGKGDVEFCAKLSLMTKAINGHSCPKPTWEKGC
jgi:hypothetical protein